MSTAEAGPDETTGASVITRVIGWLSTGYPEGIPATDRFAVVAVLKRRLSDDQVREIARQLTDTDSPASANGKIEQDEIEELIRRELQEAPSDNDIRRVSAHLAAGGWPLAGELDVDPRDSTEIDVDRTT
jgi:hypothetical protein